MKKTLSLILSLLMVFTLFAGLSVGAADESAAADGDVGTISPSPDGDSALFQREPSDLAGTGASYNLWLGSTQVTDANRNDILNDGGKAKYDPATRTLTLNNPTISGSIRSSSINLTLKGSYQMKTTPDTPDIALHVAGGSLTLDGDFLLLGLRYGIFADKDVTIKSGTLDVQEGLVNDFKDNNVAAFFGLKAGGILRIEDDVDCVSAFAASNSWGAPIGAYFMEISDKLTITDPQEGYMDSFVLKMNDYNIFTGYTIYDKYGNVPDHVMIKKPDFQWAYDVWVGGKRVTGINKKDILGDGRASFDPSTNTLTLNEPDLTIDPNRYASRISSQDIDLTIKGSYHADSSSSRFGVNIERGNLTLSGDFLFTGATDAVKASNTLYVTSGSLVAKGGIRGISARTVSLGSRAHSVEAQGTDKAISASFLKVSDYLALLTPQGGSVNDGTVYDKSGAVAKHVIFGGGVTVSFDPNGGSGSMNSITVAKGDTVTLPACTFTAPAGKAFAGWRIGRTDYQAGDTVIVSSGTTVYARWMEPVKISNIYMHGAPSAIAGQSASLNPPEGTFDENGYRLQYRDWLSRTLYGGRYRWLSFSGNFEKDVEYEAVYELKPDDGYYFAEYVNVFFDDDTFKSFSPDTRSGNLFVYYKVTAAGSSLIRGDADNDQEVTILDATAIQRHVADLPTKSFNEKTADADNDKEVTILDATAIQRYVAGLPAYAGIGKPM